MQRRVIISGGGTGGHVFPAIAIADALKDIDASIEILFVGAEGKIEMERVPKAGYKIEGLWISGFQRKLSIRNLVFPVKLVYSLLRAINIIRKFKPDVAVGVGGFASGPTLRIAGSMNIPTVIQEQNSYAGVTNRLLAARATKICVAYDGMEKFFPQDKLIFTGNPVRQGILDQQLDRSLAKERLGFEGNSKMVFIFGGSLGAKAINEAVLHNAEAIAALTGVSIYWQVGKIYYDQYKDSVLSKVNHVQIVSFVEDMDVAYAAADIVVCRAGALTISELAVLGKAAILIPSPNVAEDHQTVNSMALVDRDAAILLKDKDAKSDLMGNIADLLNDNDKCLALSHNVKYFARPDAAKVIASEILKLIKQPSI